MKLLFTYILTIGLIGFTFGQNKLEKDLEITTNILQASVQKENHLGFGNQAPVEGTFKENYGIVYSVMTSAFGELEIIMHEVKGQGFSFSYDNEGETEGDTETVVAVAPPDVEGTERDVVQRVKDFLADYAHLNRELDDHHKIMVKLGTTMNDNRFYAISSRGVDDKRVTVEVDFEDVLAHQAGNLSREEFMEKIRVEEKSILGSEPEFQIFANVLKDLFASRTSKSYYMNGSPNYERIEDLGIRYYVKVYSSWRTKKDNYRMPTIGKESVTSDERNRFVEELYPVFINDFKRAVLDYGSILQNVKEDEPIEFEIKLTECECDIAKKIELSVVKDIIDQFRNEEISLEEALEEISVQEVEK